MTINPEVLEFAKVALDEIFNRELRTKLKSKGFVPISLLHWRCKVSGQLLEIETKDYANFSLVTNVFIIENNIRIKVVTKEDLPKNLNSSASEIPVSAWTSIKEPKHKKSLVQLFEEDYENTYVNFFIQLVRERANADRDLWVRIDLLTRVSS